MRKALVLISAAVLVVSLVEPAVACRFVTDSELKLRSSQFVVDGFANCSATERSCRISADEIIKGEISSFQDTVIVPVFYPDPNPDENLIQVGCPTWTPPQAQFRGRFYLQEETDQGFIFVFPPELESVE